MECDRIAKYAYSRGNNKVHSINLISHLNSRKKPGKKTAKDNNGHLNLNVSYVQNQKKGQKNDKYHFCHKPRHIQKDCQK